MIANGVTDSNKKNKNKNNKKKTIHAILASK